MERKLESHLCRICLKKVDNKDSNDIRTLKFFDKTAIEVFIDLFGVELQLVSLSAESVPRMVCEECQNDAKTSLVLKEKAVTSHGIILRDSYTVLAIKEEEPVDLILEIGGEKNDLNICEYYSNFEVQYSPIKDELGSNYEDPLRSAAAIKKTPKRRPKILDLNVKFMCAHCPSQFARKQVLTRHLRMHFNIRPYTCCHCEKSFLTSSSLAEHIRIHTGEKPYICSVCQATFVQMSSLKVHQRRHTGEKPYKCPICGKGFARSYPYKYHLNTHDASEKTFKCEICQKLFAQQVLLTYHVKTHSTRKEFKCGVCLKEFKSRSGLYCHHKSPKYNCGQIMVHSV